MKYIFPLISLFLQTVYTFTADFTPCALPNDPVDTKSGFKTATSECLDLDWNQCSSHFSQLDATSNANADIGSNCVKDSDFSQGSSIKVFITYQDWSFKSHQSSCHLTHKTFLGKTNQQYKSSDNIQEWGQEILYQSAPQNVIDFRSAYYDQATDLIFFHLGVEDIIQGNYCHQLEGTGSDDSENIVYQCYIAHEIYYVGLPQHVYVFDVILSIARNTSAVNSLAVTKTLVQGQCCENSLGVKSKVRFCPLDDVNCLQSLTEISRNTEFLIVHYLDLTDPTTLAVSENVVLFPDEIKLGPFIMDWNFDGAEDWYGQDKDGDRNGEVHIKVKSNVAFVANIQVVSRIYDNKEFCSSDHSNNCSQNFPHNCWYVDGVQKKSTGATPECQNFEDSRRRILQSKQYGDKEQQMLSQAPIVIVQEQETVERKETTNNTLIYIVVGLGIFVIMASGLGILYYIKVSRRNKKMEEKYKAKRAHLQQEQKV